MKKTICFMVVILGMLAGGSRGALAVSLNQTDQQANQQTGQPIDYEKVFLERYKFFISDEGVEAFRKLSTDQERDKFIEDFWKDWDPDPNTPENENKIEFDQRIDNVIEDKIFFVDPNISGFTFRANGGTNRYTPAHVYIFYGEPSRKRKLSGQSFVDLMLWTYYDENGRERYRFLFYEKISQLVLFEKYAFSPDFQSMKWALWEISRSNMMNDQDALEVYNELLFRGGMEAYDFLNAMVSFSEYSHIQARSALGVPIPPAKLIGLIKVIGLPPKLNKEVIESDDPVSLVVDFRHYGSGQFVGLARFRDLDWIVLDENKLAFVFKFRAFFYNQAAKKKYVFEVSDAMISKLRGEYEQNKDKALTFMISGFREFFNSLPAGTYTVQVYVKSFATNKYAEITIDSITK